MVKSIDSRFRNTNKDDKIFDLIFSLGLAVRGWVHALPSDGEVHDNK